MMTAAVAGILTASMTDAFETVRSAAMNVVNMYEVAQTIDPWNNPKSNYMEQRMALYQAAGKLEGFSKNVIEIEFDESGRIVKSSIDYKDLKLQKQLSMGKL